MEPDTKKHPVILAALHLSRSFDPLLVSYRRRQPLPRSYERVLLDGTLVLWRRDAALRHCWPPSVGVSFRSTETYSASAYPICACARIVSEQVAATELGGVRCFVPFRRKYWQTIIHMRVGTHILPNVRLFPRGVFSSYARRLRIVAEELSCRRTPRRRLNSFRIRRNVSAEIAS